MPRFLVKSEDIYGNSRDEVYAVDRIETDGGSLCLFVDEKLVAAFRPAGWRSVKMIPDDAVADPYTEATRAHL